jgi:hypothetical protein
MYSLFGRQVTTCSLAGGGPQKPSYYLNRGLANNAPVPGIRLTSV